MVTTHNLSQIRRFDTRSMRNNRMDRERLNNAVQRSRATVFGRSESFPLAIVFGTCVFYFLVRSAC